MPSLRELAVSALVLAVALAGADAVQAFRSAAPPPPHIASALPAKSVVMVKTLVDAPRSEPPQALTVARAVSRQALPPDAVAATPLPPQAATPDPAATAAETSLIAARVSAKVPAALAPYFDTFIYVSKSASGPWAQHLFLFRKGADGTLAFEQSFAVSTGRERAEQYFTATPTGLFELDVHRFFPMARSAKWDDAQMPWAMFLNYSYRTQMSGVALHAAIGAHELSLIGHRASGGCVRLPLAKANALYHRFLAEERGQVPVLAFDQVRGTTNVEGIAVHDGAGNIELADGLRVLVVIDNFGGSAAEPSQS